MPDPVINAKIDVPGAIDPKDAALIEKSIKGPEQVPTTRDATPAGTDWKRLSAQLGSPYDPTKVPLRKLREMREDPMIAFGLHYKIVPLVRANWHMDARDANGPNAQVAAFMDAAWRFIHARYMLQHAHGVLSFGYQALGKRFQLANPGGVYVDEGGNTQPVWSEGSILPVIWKPFAALEPEKVTPRFDDNSGEFDGIDLELDLANRKKTSGVGGSRKKSGNQNTQEIDVWHSLWATNERDFAFGSLYGKPLLRNAYRHWWSYWWRWQQYDRAFERLAVPPIVAYHPDGNWTDPETGEQIPYQTIALNAAEKLRSNAIAAVPSTLASSGLEEKGTVKREWEFEFLEPKNANVFDKFDSAFNYLDVMKLRSLWVPEQAFIEGEGGTSSRNVASQMAEVFIESQALLWDEIADHINRYILPQLLLINFPEFVANGGTCRIVGHGFAKEDLDLLKQIIQLIGQADPTSLGVDIREALRRLNIPLMSPEALTAQQAQLARAASQPPRVNGGRNGLSVVPLNPGQTNGGSVPEPNAPGSSALGFADDNWNGEEQRFVYVAPGEHITLSDTEDFLTDLPSSKHYSDKAMKALAVQMRKAWIAHYKALYPDFAEHLNQYTSMEFADSVPKKAAVKAANKLIREWEASSDAIERVTKRSKQIIAKMLKRSIKLEAKAINGKADLTQEALDNWMEGQVAKLIRNTHDTVKDELHTFLVPKIRDGLSPQEIAKGVREHFSDFPGWKASRVARSETRDVVNAGTLLTGEHNGLKWTRATDGEEFDQDCKDRNGKLLTIREAWKELTKEHSNGTLGFDLIPRADFSIKWVPEMPDDSDRAAYFDDETGTAFVKLGADGPEVDNWLFSLGEKLTDPRYAEFLDHEEIAA
jgi:hypothetical protein